MTVKVYKNIRGKYKNSWPPDPSTLAAILFLKLSKASGVQIRLTLNNHIYFIN